MPEADWWLCDTCGSLNYLAVQKCYSCRRRKRTATVNWDGKVSSAAAPNYMDWLLEQRPRAMHPPPLREPFPRHITDVAPRFPHGVRMTYRPAEVSLFPDAWPRSPVRVAGRRSSLEPPPGRLRRLVAIPIDTGEPRPLVTIPIEPAAPTEAPVPSLEPGYASGPPPHWNDLLDVPTPDAGRLRQALTSGVHRPRLRRLAELADGAQLRGPGATET